MDEIVSKYPNEQLVDFVNRIGINTKLLETFDSEDNNFENNDIADEQIEEEYLKYMEPYLTSSSEEEGEVDDIDNYNDDFQINNNINKDVDEIDYVDLELQLNEIIKNELYIETLKQNKNKNVNLQRIKLQFSKIMESIKINKNRIKRKFKLIYDNLCLLLESAKTFINKQTEKLSEKQSNLYSLFFEKTEIPSENTLDPCNIKLIILRRFARTI